MLEAWNIEIITMPSRRKPGAAIHTVAMAKVHVLQNIGLFGQTS